MKKLFLFTITICLLSCGTSKTVRQSKKVIKGDWTLSSITYNQTGTFNVSLFGEASKDCFEGSTWRFIPNNNTGKYTINNANCSTGERNFIFTIQEALFGWELTMQVFINGMEITLINLVCRN